MACYLKQGGPEFQEKTHPSSPDVKQGAGGAQWALAFTQHRVRVCRVVLLQNPADYTK